MKRIAQFVKEMERSEKCDDRMAANYFSFRHYFYEAARRNNRHLVLQGVVDDKYTTGKMAGCIVVSRVVPG